MLDFITKHINKEYIITGAPQREERWDYPLDALREIVINSIVHRDYSGSTTGVVKVFDDKIQIYNSGKLPHGLTVPMLLRGEYTSAPRNVQVADMFKEAGIIERYGSGIGRIVDEFKACGLAAPEFKEIGDGFMVTVFKKRLSGLTRKSSQKSSQKIIDLIRSNASITIEEMAVELSLTDRAIKKNLAALKNAGKLSRIGPDKGGHWAVIE